MLEKRPKLHFEHNHKEVDLPALIVYIRNVVLSRFDA